MLPIITPTRRINRIQRLLALLEPTMLVVLAIFAGIIVVSIYLPIFTMYDLMLSRN